MKAPADVPEPKPGEASRWVIVGTAGREVPDNVIAVRAAAYVLMLEHGKRSALVHADGCSPTQCTCKPEVITR